ncbi:hypothetical protein SEA_BIG4_72 [Microbacterium phage Big4]|nr:hypothetical protein SEA_BIG4_72 [Microbacterium phage Big4]
MDPRKDWQDKFNVPGSVEYNPRLVDDFVLQSTLDERLRGYWTGWDYDGQLAFASNQNEADHVLVGADEDGTPTIIYDDELSTEFSFDGLHTIAIRAYS